MVKKFSEDERTCLFGTLSLWQGVDVPGPSLQLVIMDRIPFPRPDDPLASARQKVVNSRGGNGFLTVAATHAALLLTQATARYGGFLRASLPPFWTTYDPDGGQGRAQAPGRGSDPLIRSMSSSRYSRTA